MNIIKVTDEKQIREAAGYMCEHNSYSKYHIGYCGHNIDEIESSVKELIINDNEFFIAHENGEIVGVIGYEQYDDTVEVWGPFIDEHTHHVLEKLWDTMIKSLSDNSYKYLIYCNIQNEIIINFAKSNGFEYIGEGTVMKLNLNNIEGSVASQVYSLKSNDSNEVAKLHDSIFPNTYIDGSNLTKNDGEHEILIVKHNDKIAGYICFTVNDEFNEGDIEFIGVAESFRGQGLGKDLLISALKEFKNKGISNLQLWVGKENENARNLYKKVGFTVENEMVTYKLVN